LAPLHHKLDSPVITHNVAVAHSADGAIVIAMQEYMTMQGNMLV
jgi:hypothetical protein